MKTNQASILKFSAVLIAIPRYAGAFALSAGFVAEGDLHTYLGITEVVAGIAMAVLEGFALAFILSKWRLLKVYSYPWYALLAVSLLLALSLPLVAIPYLYFMQTNFKGVTELFNSLLLQNTWNFIVAFVPMLIVIGVGLADVNELEREQKQLELELEISRKRANLQVELSKLELEVEKEKVTNELEIRKLRAEHRVSLSNVEARAEQAISKEFVCENCGAAYEEERQLRGHKAHCKARVNGKVKSEQVTA